MGCALVIIASSMARISLSSQHTRLNCMANVVATVINVPTTKYVIFSIIALTTVVTLFYYQYYVLRLLSLPYAARQHCTLMKRQRTGPGRNTTPPWLSLLADYQATVRSGRNLYVWPYLERGRRLGNILFNYAATFGIAWQNQRIPIWPDNPSKKEYHIPDFFNLRIPVDVNKSVVDNPVARSRRIRASGNGIYDPKFEQLPARNVAIHSVFSSYKYFQHVEEELRIDLTFKPIILETARRWLEERTPGSWKDKDFMRVLIHVRRNDYLQAYHERGGMPRPTAGYFQRSMSYFTDCLERVQFVVVSDDPPWCMQHIHAPNIVYSSGHSPIEDLAIASLCDHAIITVGTYGWWAAWFANGVTITQQNLPINGSKLSKRLYRSDHYKPDWIGM